MQVFLSFISVCLATLMLTGCIPVPVIGMVGNVVNQVMWNVTTDQSAEPYISDTQSYNHDRGAIADANLNLGIAYMQQGQYQLALDKLERARIAQPDYAPTYNVLGLLYQRVGRPEEAEKYFQHSLQLDENNSMTLNNYGQFLCSQDRGAEAEKYFLEAAENPLYKTPEIPYTNIGTCAYLHNEPDKAVDYFQKALDLNPNVPVALINLSQINYDKGDYSAARDYLNRYRTYNPHTANSLWLGIRIERELGDKDTLSSYALLLRNKYPDSDEAKLLNEAGIK